SPPGGNAGDAEGEEGGEAAFPEFGGFSVGGGGGTLTGGGFAGENGGVRECPGPNPREGTKAEAGELETGGKGASCAIAGGIEGGQGGAGYYGGGGGAAYWAGGGGGGGSSLVPAGGSFGIAGKFLPEPVLVQIS